MSNGAYAPGKGHISREGGNPFQTLCGAQPVSMAEGRRLRRQAFARVGQDLLFIEQAQRLNGWWYDYTKIARGITNRLI